MNVLTNLNLNNNEIQNFVVQVLAVAPPNPKKGRMYFDSVTNSLKQWDGTAWNEVGKEQIFWCEYNSTTYTQIANALEAEKQPMLNYNGFIYHYIGDVYGSTGDWVFVGFEIAANGAITLVFIICNASDQWSEMKNQIATWALVQTALGDFLPLNGGTMTGPLILSGAPTANLHAATKKYVDDGLGNKIGKASSPTTGNFMSFDASGNAADSGKKASDFANASHTHSYLPLSGGTMTGNITLVGAPSANLHPASKKYVDDAIAGLALITITVVTSLPSTGASNVIYLVPKSAAQTSNAYDEYIWVASTSKYEKVGDTEIDLSNYLQTTGNASSTTVAFTAAETRVLPATGESLATIIGKATKYFTDLKTVAFSGSYNDLSNKPTQPSINTATMSTSETTKSITATGTTVVNVQIVDSVTHEVVVADVTINGKAVTVTVAAAPTNALTITVLSI